MTRLTLAAPITAADAGRRTITGTIVTWGEVGNTSAGPAKFEAGSIQAADDVVLRLEHDRTRPLGRAIELADTPQGMTGTFRIAATAAGNDALVEAADGLRDGLSVGVEVLESSLDADGTLVVLAARMDEVSLVTHPAIQSARVTEVAAAEPDEPTDPAPTEAEEPTPEEGVTVDESTPAVVEATAADVPRVHVTVEPFPYGRDGVQASFFRDMVNAQGDVQAAQRVSQAKSMLEAAAKRTDVAEVIPPGYRPDLYQGEDPIGMPIASSITQMSISDATPFKIPRFATAVDLAKDHVEGTNPTDGTITFAEITVTPKAISGKFTASREMLDAANPNLDAIIMKAMAEDYANKVEQETATALFTAATAGVNAAGGKVSVALLNALATYATTRTLPADRIALGSGYFGKIAAEVDSGGRPLNPYLNPSNADGTIGAAVASVSFAGLAARMAWSTAAKNAVVYRSGDFISFRSPRLSWRWEEVAGPAQIVFAQFGYTAFAALRSDGAIKLTDGTT